MEQLSKLESEVYIKSNKTIRERLDETHSIESNTKIYKDRI